MKTNTIKKKMKLPSLKHLKQNISSPFGSLGGFFVLPLLLLPFMGFAQEQTTEPIKQEVKSYKNQIDLDVYYLGVEFTYKRKVANKLFVGVGVGGLMGKFNANNNGTVGELVRAKLMLDYIVNDKFHIGQGIIVAVGYLSDKDLFTPLIDFELSLFYNLGKIEFGFKPSIILYQHNNENKAYLSTSLLILKIPLGRW